MTNQLRSPTKIGHLFLSDNSTDDYLYVQGVPITGESSSDLNIENGTGDYSIVQKETSAHQGQATGKGAIAFGGFRGDKPNDTPNPIPNDDASVNNLDQDEYNDTISKVTGIQSYVFGAGNRAYGNWNFIMGKDSKTCSRAAYIFGSKNYVGNPNNGNMYLHSMAVGSLNSVKSTNTFVAGTQNTVTNTDGAVALGIGNSITNNGYAVGIANTLTSNYSVALGNMNTLSATYGGALGTANTISSAYGKAIGTSNKVSGNFSIAIGNGLLTSYESQIALGNYNIPGDANTLLVLGNGTADNARSNAMTVYKNGTVDVQKLSIHKPLLIYGGDSATAAKITLDQSRSGQITDNGTKTLFGFTDITDLKVGSTSYTLSLRGRGSLTYNVDKFEVTQEGYIRLPNFTSTSATTPSGYKTFKCVNGVLTAID